MYYLTDTLTNKPDKRFKNIVQSVILYLIIIVTNKPDKFKNIVQLVEKHYSINLNLWKNHYKNITKGAKKFPKTPS